MNLSAYLKQKLKEKNMTIKELAFKADLSASTISAFVNGRRDNPSTETIYKLAGALHVNVFELGSKTASKHTFEVAITKTAAEQGLTYNEAIEKLTPKGLPPYV